MCGTTLYHALYYNIITSYGLPSLGERVQILVFTNGWQILLGVSESRVGRVWAELRQDVVLGLGAQFYKQEFSALHGGLGGFAPPNNYGVNFY